MMATCPMGFIIHDLIFTGMRPLDLQTPDPAVPLLCVQEGSSSAWRG